MNEAPYITKGTRVRARWFVAKPLGTWSLAGSQMKLNGTMHDIEGVVRHVRSDDPVKEVNVTIHVETEDEQGTLCPKCNVNEVEIKPEWIVKGTIYPDG